MTLTRLLDSTDGYLIGRSPEVLETKGLGPCVGVAVYDQRRKVGVLGHFASPRDSQSFAEMIVWAVTNLRPSRLEVTLTGATLETSRTNAAGLEYLGFINRHVLGKREYVALAFQNIGVRAANIAQKFPDPDMVTDLSLDTSTGKVEIGCEDLQKILDSYNANL